MDINDELKVLKDTYQLISSVDKSTQIRILNWLNQKIMPNDQPGDIHEKTVIIEPQPAPLQTKKGNSLPLLSQLIHSKILKNDQERCLLIALYVQNQTQEFSSRLISDTSLAIGCHFSNLTRTLTFLTKKHDAPLIQINKKGHTKQAQRVFSFNNSGILLAEHLWQKALNEHKH